MGCVGRCANAGFCPFLRFALHLSSAAHPTRALLWVMVIAQGTLGYALTSVMGPIPNEIFAGKHYGAIFGTVMLSAILGAAAGPWVAGFLHDMTGNYAAAFWIAIGCTPVSAAAIWRAAPGTVRAVAGRVHRIAEAHVSSS